MQCHNQDSDCSPVCPPYSDFSVLFVSLCVCLFRSIQCDPVCTWLYLPAQQLFTLTLYNSLHFPLDIEPLLPHVEMKLHGVVMQSSETGFSLQISFCGIPGLVSFVITICSLFCLCIIHNPRETSVVTVLRFIIQLL